MSLTFSTAASTAPSSSTTSDTTVLRIPSSSKLSRLQQEPLAHLPPSDRVKFAEYGLGPRRRVDIPLVHAGFERHVRSQPDAVAVEHSLFNHSLTYAQLDRKANRLARRLRAAGVAPGARVVVLTRRSIYYVVAVLAVLKAGGQYVPQDAVTVTDDTLAHVLSDSGATLCLVMDEYAHRVRDKPKMVIEEAIREDEMKDAPADKPEELATPDDGCYVIYTSGTTGKPQGVDVRHSGVSNGMCFCRLHLLRGSDISSSHFGLPGQCRHAAWHAGCPVAEHCV
jgi:non-ribosomal peptide synthetase component F